MSPRRISSAVLAAALVLATPGPAVASVVRGASSETIVAAPNWLEAGGQGAAFSGPGGISAPDDSGFDQPAEPVQDEARARSESDWLTAPPDPARHNLWVPTVEWATALSLTIPLFMIDPSFVNVDPISADNFVDAWTRPPVWDTDGVIANYVLHPIMGAEAYLMVRNRDYGPLESFLFSTGVSFAWEYLFEAWVERPSAQDLLTTSPIGSLQGELRFQLRRRIARWNPSAGRDTLLILVDPVEALHRYVGKEFFNHTDDATDGTMGSALNFGPGQANLMVTLRY